MALTGHSDDCAACTYADLPDEDRAVLEPAAFTEHTRREPPVVPPLPNPLLARTAAGLAGVLLLAALVATSTVVVALFGVAILVAAGLGCRLEDQRRKVLAGWWVHFNAWSAQQTEAWLTARNQGKTWPCPACGSLSCSNQHTVTRTTGTRWGPFYNATSRTDSV